MVIESGVIRTMFVGEVLTRINNLRYNIRFLITCTVGLNRLLYRTISKIHLRVIQKLSWIFTVLLTKKTVFNYPLKLIGEVIRD